MIHGVAGQLVLLVCDSAAADKKSDICERRMLVPAPRTTAQPSALCRVSGVHFVACLMYFCRAAGLFIGDLACLEQQQDLRSHVRKRRKSTKPWVHEYFVKV
jgi:hypothetical protein